MATDLNRFLDRLQRHDSTSPIILSHMSRNDIILGYLSHWQKCKAKGKHWTGSLVLATGSSRDEDGAETEILPHVLETIVAMDVPVLVVNGNTFQIMQKLEEFTPKLNYKDTDRVAVACKHVADHIDFATLEQQLLK